MAAKSKELQDVRDALSKASAELEAANERIASVSAQSVAAAGTPPSPPTSSSAPDSSRSSLRGPLWILGGAIATVLALVFFGSVSTASQGDRDAFVLFGLVASAAAVSMFFSAKKAMVPKRSAQMNAPAFPSRTRHPG